MSSFDEVKNFYVYKYVVDSVTDEPTEYEGEIQAFVKGTNSFDVLTGEFDDVNVYGARRIDDLKTFEDAIKKERKHLTKISKQLKAMVDEENAERQKIIEDRECPNGCGKLDENFSCPKCGFGHEAEYLVKELEKSIKEEKKKGNDTSELEAMRDSIKDSIK